MALSVMTLAIGDELLDGRIADTNSQTLADALYRHRVSLSGARVVDDDIDRIEAALLDLAATADIIVTSGGLGPTTDDVTAQAVARAAGVDVTRDQATLDKLQALFAKRTLPMPANNERQADVPVGADIWPNGAGISPGFLTRVGPATVVSLPGVPREYRWFVAEHVVGLVTGRLPDRVATAHRTVRGLGIAESALADVVEKMQLGPEVRIQYRTRFPENHVRFIVTAKSPEEADARAAQLAEEAAAAIGGAVYAIGERDLEDLLLTALVDAEATVSLAESCTGGLIAERLTAVPGASRAFWGGAVTYANEAKVAVLGVNPDTLAAHGAVSEEVAAEMAQGARERLGTTYALSVTGIAGPDGGTPEKPVGTVCFGLAGPAGVKTKLRRLPDFGRGGIRALAASVALRFLLQELTR